MDLADPERALALAYAPAARRPALALLWRLDERMGEVLAVAREPMLRAIRLAWWREALEALDRGGVPDEPLLCEVAATLLPAGLRGVELAGLEEGWAVLADPEPDAEALALHCEARGARFFALSARLLRGASDPAIEAAGAGWALADAAARLPEPARGRALAQATTRLADAPRRWPRALRPLGVLTVLARRDAAGIPRRVGSPARVMRAITVGITGR